ICTFFFSIRRRHTRSTRDWSSDVCSSDLSRQKSWVVYAKKPFGSPQTVLDYLGRYTHRVALSNNRILALENGQVTFSYRDRRDKIGRASCRERRQCSKLSVRSKDNKHYNS